MTSGGTVISPQLVTAAEAWLAQDPDPVTRAETESLLFALRSPSTEGEAAAELADRFGARLDFGTAGLRGALGAGPNRMNRVLVGQAAAGLGRYLLAADAAAHASDAGGSVPLVVIGYDGRVNSEVFARDSAEILAGLGLQAVLLPRMLPTPVLAYAVRALNAAAGVMVTASHNPPQDNGYKVYLGGANNGSQIVTPADAEIAAQIEAVAHSTPFDAHPRGSYMTADESVIADYVAATAALLHPGASTPRFVYTAMHGVGTETFLSVLDAAGYPHPELVAEQCQPDGTFPTVAFPNPEEPGALDLAMALATRVDAELIVAHDPDADRLAVAIPEPGAASGWRRLSGNEVGLLLGWRIAELASRAAGEGAPSGTLACSIVSSPGLRAVAEEYQLDFANTLTGFKWISRAPGLVFGFEEALGYLVNPHDLRDKDGISASAVFLSLVSELASEGKSIADHLAAFDLRFGCYASSQVSLRVTELSLIAELMHQLRSAPPAEIGGAPVDRIEDLADGYDSIPPSDVLRIWMRDGSRIMVRPSGTEPKLKVYIDAMSNAGTLDERRAAAHAAVAQLEAGMRELLHS